MTITVNEIEDFVEHTWAMHDEDRIPYSTEEQVTKWITGILKSHPSRDQSFEVPILFLPIVTDLRRSQGNPFATPQREIKTLRYDGLKTPMNTSAILKDYNRVMGATKGAFQRLESARRRGSETDIDLTTRAAFKAIALEKRAACRDPIENLLAESPDEGLLWGGIARLACGAQPTPDEMAVVKAWVPGDTMGAGMFPVPVSPDVWDLLLTYGAFRDLGLKPMQGQYTRFAQVTGLPDAYVFSPDMQGLGAPPVDASLAGKSLYEASNTFSCLLQISREWLNDVRFDVGSAVLSRVVPGLAKRVDWCAFQGNGVDDLLNGAQTGIFVDQTIPTYKPLVGGKTTIVALERGDFIGVIGSVAPAALQRPCRWYINPGLIPNLMPLKDGDGNSWLLRTPAETGGEWHLVGYPVTWAAQAPALNQAGAKIAAFGEPSSYLVALRQELEMMSSESGATFSQNARNIRALMRGRVQTRESTGLATLTLSPQ
jgi:hypothetical protein